MIYGFNDSKEKVEVLPKSEIVTVTASVTVPAGESAYALLYPANMEAFGMENGNPNNYVLIGIEYKDHNDSTNRWIKSFKVFDGDIYPLCGIIPFHSNEFNMRIYCYNSGDSEKTYDVRLKFIKA